ncbi:hypothetical protein [Bradyrhizobium sp. STM 3557]|uniref:hypothetical protein n=1 Tax=Bradyrhizobium sp. STM 3557 TaxID=578920 RepID=UPI00388DA196
MTVSSEACGPTNLRWTGVETSFTPGWQAQDVAAVEVYYLADAPGSAEVLLTLGIHYAAALAAGTGFVTATPVALPPAPGTLTFLRKTPALQETDFQNLRSFDAATHTRLHDAAAMRDAEQRRDILSAFGADPTQAMIAAASAILAEAINAVLGAPPTKIDITKSPYQVQFGDLYLAVDTSGGPVVIELPPAIARAGRPVIVKDFTGHAAAAGRNISIIPNGAETIEGLNPLPIKANYGGFRLRPSTLKYVIDP